MKIFTCAFEPWDTTARFWKRDSGLICKSLQSVGIQSKVILPTRPDPTSETDVIRASHSELRSTSWWGQQELDGIVFITWGRKKDTAIVQAAKSAGIIVILLADDSLLNWKSSILSTFSSAWHKRYHMPFLRRLMESIYKTPPLVAMDAWRGRGKTQQYLISDLMCCWSPIVWETADRRVRNSADVFFTYPSCSLNIAPEDFPDNQFDKTEHHVVAVADWSKVNHKRPHFFIRACRILFDRDPKVAIHVYGKMHPIITTFYSGLPASIQPRLILHGFESNEQIVRAMSSCHVAVCPSASDGGPVPMAEALCQGCSVVGGGNIVEWAAKCNFGTYEIASPKRMADAIHLELQKWSSGTYNRKQNAAFWRKHYDAHIFAKVIRDFILQNPKTTQNLSR